MTPLSVKMWAWRDPEEKAIFVSKKKPKPKEDIDGRQFFFTNLSIPLCQRGWKRIFKRYEVGKRPRLVEITIREAKGDTL